MDQVFKALADPTRRKLLDRLASKPGQSLGLLVTDLQMSRQSASRHLQVLEEADLITIRWSGREKRHYLNPVPIAEIARRWIDKFSEPKMQALINLKQALEDDNNNQ